MVVLHLSIKSSNKIVMWMCIFKKLHSLYIILVSKSNLHIFKWTCNVYSAFYYIKTLLHWQFWVDIFILVCNLLRNAELGQKYCSFAFFILTSHFYRHVRESNCINCFLRLRKFLERLRNFCEVQNVTFHSRWREVSHSGSIFFEHFLYACLLSCYPSIFNSRIHIVSIYLY